MSMPHVGDWGTILRGTLRDEDGVVVDLSASTGVKIDFKRPDGTTTGQQTASITNAPGTNGKVHYTVPQNLQLFTKPGRYKVEFFVTFADGSYATDVYEFEVGDIIQ